MRETIVKCDVCKRIINCNLDKNGQIVPNDGWIVPDGHGGFINLKTKYPHNIVFKRLYKDDTPIDLCVSCSMNIYRHIRKLEFDNDNPAFDPQDLHTP